MQDLLEAVFCQFLNLYENHALYYPFLGPWAIAETPEVLAAVKELRLAH